MIYQGKKMDYC